MPTLTERQRDILAFVERTLASRGVAPTLREIAAEFGLRSTATAQKHLLRLEAKGLLRRDKHQKRGLSLASGAASPLAEVPLLGAVAAGSPVEVLADPESLAVPPTLLRGGEHFALRVRGDSMVGDGIHDNDVVVVQRREAARDGDMVVALVGGEVTLKRFYRHAPGVVRLQPANPAFAALLVHAAELRVQGVVVGLLRRY